MDSVPNGDLDATTIVLIGGDVGGPAGYEAAFQLSPNSHLRALKSASVWHGQLLLTFYDELNKIKKHIYRYNPVNKTLSEK